MNFFNILNCSHNLFSSSDYNQNNITKENLSLHNTNDNAWISYNNNVYSIQKNDDFLLNLFNNYYGKDVSELIEKLNYKEKKLVLNKLKSRFIGKIN